MSLTAPQFSTNLSLTEMEAFIRRVVKEAVHEEFARVLRQTSVSIVADWGHEGPDDPEGDRLLLAEALEERDQYRINPEGWSEWDAFKAELKAMAQRTPNDPKTKQTLETINNFHRAFNQHAVDAIMALMTEDCVFETTYPPPDGVRLIGHDAVREFWIDLFQGSPQAHFVVEEVFACNDRGVLRWIYTWAGADGQPGHVRGVDIFRVRAGKVAEKLSYVKG